MISALRTHILPADVTRIGEIAEVHGAICHNNCLIRPNGPVQGFINPQWHVGTVIGAVTSKEIQ